MGYYEMYLMLLLLIKLAFVYFVIKEHVAPTDFDSEYLLKTERLFTILMSLLMVYLFHPGQRPDVRIDHETKLFLFVFALLMFIDTMKARSVTKETKTKSHA